MAFFEMARIAMGTLFRRPATRRYPAVAAKQMPLSRGHVTIDESRCISCGMCMRKCPAEAICVEKEEKTWKIDRLRCVVCNCCVEVCPVHCLFMDTVYSPALTEHAGVDIVNITYVKPERPAKKETAEEGSG
ncbi:formate hydrogenlyase subunit 6/NADH:ubiquinone oxidoreductase subunit I [Methanolinea mesophila]|uniref:4Fe-4S binding protein n=1 Tax=Methanolinea mesophila TaxID=547055 RepID=UPI001AEB4FB6|nr:4Fe-4S binding protein [Methanolinea mesophila]MBP1927509.1 formate hydrogenlyase subunit 6/NADH:ubiquinone oxidoreductase subunit I [Methanolinea mesophila]